MAASLAEKLQIRTGQGVAVLSAPAGYLAKLAAELEGVSVSAQPMGWRPVRQIALDNVWSAMRFRPSDQVGR
jgi:hypothetical protein